MKRIVLLLSAFLLLFMTASCSSDDNNENIVADYNYGFSFSISVTDINNNNLLSANKSDDSYYIEDISIKSTREKDNITLVSQTYSTGLVSDETVTKLLVNVDSYESDGIIEHGFVIQWYDSKMADTIIFEIEKSNNDISCKSISVNNTLERFTSFPYSPQIIHITKITPSEYRLLDKNNSETLIEKEVDGLKFSFWLSDIDDKTTNIFNEKDVRERGFKFNMSLTNNSDRNIFIDNFEIEPYLSNIFNAYDDKFIGRSCAMFNDILLIHKIQPGETHFESMYWCNENMYNGKPLQTGKYYTYFGKNITYESGDNYDIGDATKTNTTRKTVKIPPMLINFEVK